MRTAAKRTNRQQSRAAIAAREVFTNSTGSLRGFKGLGLGLATGELNDAERQKFLDAAPDITYLVVSYDTPIAWEVDDKFYRVGQYFSPTTSCHMGMVPR